MAEIKERFSISPVTNERVLEENKEESFTDKVKRRMDDNAKPLLKEIKDRLVMKIAGWGCVIFYYGCNIFFHAVGYQYFIVPGIVDSQILPYMYMISFLSVLFYTIGSFGDPGHLPRNTATERELQNPGNLKICYTCKLVKPFRSKHCSVCNRCVSKFDHHCPFFNNCVGANTDPYFIGFLFTQNLTLLIVLYLGIPG